MRIVLQVWLFGLGLVALPLAGAADPFANLPDPTRPSGWQESSGGATVREGLQLQSTRVSPHERIAVINGQRLAVGDQIQGATVTNIQSYQVQMQRGGRELTLRLMPPIAKEKRK